MLLSGFRTLATTYHTPPGEMTPVLRMPWRANEGGSREPQICMHATCRPEHHANAHKKTRCT